MNSSKTHPSSIRLAESLLAALDGRARGPKFQRYCQSWSEQEGSAAHAAARLVHMALGDRAHFEMVRRNSYRHALGFDKLVLHRYPQSEASIRLHAWWADEPRLVEDIHNHRFPFFSFVLKGHLTSTQFRRSAGTGIQFRHLEEFGDLAECAWRFRDLGEARLTRQSEAVICSPASYLLESDVLHRIVVPADVDVLTLVVHPDVHRPRTDVFVESRSAVSLHHPQVRFDAGQLEQRLRRVLTILDTAVGRDVLVE